MNPEGLRSEDEFVRHKLLDAVGDLALAGGHISGCYEAERPGHALNNALLIKLLDTPGAWQRAGDSRTLVGALWHLGLPEGRRGGDPRFEEEGGLHFNVRYIHRCIDIYIYRYIHIYIHEYIHIYIYI